MANPTHRHCRSRRDKRRANWKGRLPQMSVCTQCGQPRLPHRACMSCGMYGDRKIIEVVEKEA